MGMEVSNASFFCCCCCCLFVFFLLLLLLFFFFLKKSLNFKMGEDPKPKNLPWERYGYFLKTMRSSFSSLVYKNKFLNKNLCNSKEIKPPCCFSFVGVV